VAETKQENSTSLFGSSLAKPGFRFIQKSQPWTEPKSEVIQYFLVHNISLELMVHWLSTDTVMFEVDVGV